MKLFKLLLLGYILVMVSSSGFAQNSLDFDGGNDYVQTTYAGVLGSANRTFEAWIYVDSSAPASNLTIVDYGLNAGGSRNTFAVKGDRGINFTSGGTNANIGSSAGLILDEQWTHVAFVLDNGTGYLYVNGNQVGTGSLTSVNTPSGNSDLRIGQRVSGGSIPFNGRIDEVRIWNVAKTQQELAANMNREVCATPVDLAAYYKLDEGVAGGTNTAITTAVDEVAGANGSLSNFALTGTNSNWLAGVVLSVGSVVNNLTLNECEGFSITVGNNTYNTTGNYSDTLIAASVNGCDSIVNIDLTITTIDLTVAITSPTLTANQAGATYQWLDCNDNFAVISGAINQEFTATVGGNYAVEISFINCVDTSTCQDLTSVGINELKQKSVAIYPNPVIDNIYIDLGTQVDVLNYSLTTITGKLIKENTFINPGTISIDISNQKKGIYFLNLNNITYKVIKK